MNIQMVKQLSFEEQVSFMKVIYSIFMRDGKVSSWERDILKSLSEAFQFSKGDESGFATMYYPNVDMIAQEVNQIKDGRSRYWLLRILLDALKQGVIIDMGEMEKTFFHQLLSKVKLNDLYYTELEKRTVSRIDELKSSARGAIDDVLSWGAEKVERKTD